MEPSLQLRVSGKVPIELHQAQGPISTAGRWLALVKDLSPVVTAVAGVAISFAVFYYGNQLNSRQEEVNSESLRANVLKSVTELKPSDPDFNAKQELTAIALAQFKDGAVPAIWMFLASNDQVNWRYGVLAAAKLFQADDASAKSLMERVVAGFSSRSTCNRRAGAALENVRRVYPRAARACRLQSLRSGR